MTSTAMEAGWGFDAMLQAWEETDVPNGWRTEITEKGITVTPPPSPAHILITSLVEDALRQSLPSGVAAVQNLGVRVSEASRLYVPDLAILQWRALETNQSSVPADELILVVEVTSRDNAADDRTSKKAAYARGEVPSYLLVDRFDDDGPAVTLFTEPAGFHYRSSKQVPLGEPISLPFDIELDTAKFPRPSPE